MSSKSIVRGIIIAMLVISCFSSFIYIERGTAEVFPKFYVDDDYNSETPGWNVDHFDNIQFAIKNASAGDRILVYAGTYTENIRINSSKTNLDLFGEDRDTAIITGVGTNNDVVIVSATGVDISSFTIQTSGTTSNNSVIKVNAGNCTITDCKIKSGQRGVFISNCDTNKIYYNTITSNSADGIYLDSSDSNSITYSTITSNTYNGIFAYNSSSNTIGNCIIQSNSQNGIFINESGESTTISNSNISSNSYNGIFFNNFCNNSTISSNQIHGNTYSGIRLENSSINTLSGNTIRTNNDYGIMIVGKHNSINNNTVNDNAEHGIFLFADDNNDVLDNSIRDNTKDGLRMMNSTSDTVLRNKITGNSRYGIYLSYYTYNNQIYNNYFKANTQNNSVDVSENHNTWYIAKTAGTNIVNGSYISGNYWGDYDQVSEGANDGNLDGIADSPRSIDVSSSDGGPLLDIKNPNVQTPSVSPSSQSQGSYTHISAVVTDTDTEITAVNLTITDPNGIVSNFSILQNKTENTYYCNKIYSTIGNYSFSVDAKDTRNWANTTGSFYIHEGNPPTVTDNSPTTSAPYVYFAFNATVTSGDTSASDLSVYVNWDHGSNGENNSMINTADNYFEKTVSLDKNIESLTYTIFAKDKWGNSVTTSSKSVTITDTQAPTITIDRYGPSFEDLPNSYTYAVTVTDDVAVSAVTIEYWSNESIKMTANMENTATNYYKKVITPADSPENIYCVIYANDTSNNIANTKNPYANAGGPYTGIVTEIISFNGSNSFDLDGNISSYSWNFGDGTTGSSQNPTHSYSASGSYTITLTVTDNEDQTNLDTTTVTISGFTKQEVSQSALATIESTYDITLDELFYAYDIDNDGKADSFIDPNGVLEVLHSGHINISNNAHFLLSVNNNLDKIFIWNSNTNAITNVTYNMGSITSDETNDDEGTRTVTISVTKAIWTYIEATDNYEDDSLTVKRSDDTIVSPDFVWRKNGKIYILDDPDTTYQLIYSYTPPPVVIEPATFSPEDGGTINQDSTTITVTYQDLVDIEYATFTQVDPVTKNPINTQDMLYITSELQTTDNMVFTYTPPSNLPTGTYQLSIDVVSQEDPSKLSYSSAFYEFESYAMAKITPFLIMFGILTGALVTLFVLFRIKNITFESFIYIKGRKIIPFFKPLVFGPLSLDVSNEKISKAEFYVNGKLKDTITQEPYVWKFNEPAFLKHNIEAKVYDENGKVNSSGEMTFYMFNPIKPPK